MEFLVVLIKFSVILLDFTGFQWLSSDSWWVWYSFIRFKLVSVFVFTAFDWVSVAFIGLWMVLFDITGFQLIWSGLSGWNRGYRDVSLGATDFDSILASFAWRVTVDSLKFWPVRFVWNFTGFGDLFSSDSPIEYRRCESPRPNKPKKVALAPFPWS